MIVAEGNYEQPYCYPAIYHRGNSHFSWTYLTQEISRCVRLHSRDQDAR